MKLLVTGANGQLGRALVRQAGSYEMLALDRKGLDITDASAVNSIITSFRPDAVINAAAYTAVDRAETDREAAFAVNRDGPGNLASTCASLDIPLVHISTDYVFDGTKQGAYVEDDPIAPLGVYGESKAAGEALVRERCPKHLILRTSWVFSADGNNFVKTMLRLGAEREELGVVADQFGKPTAAAELACVTLLILPKMNEYWGTYHIAQPNVTSWHGFAEAIFVKAKNQGIDLKLKILNAIATSDYPTCAKRPTNSELDCAKFETSFGMLIKHWKGSLTGVIGSL